jgi:hypothetical protein
MKKHASQSQEDRDLNINDRKKVRPPEGILVVGPQFAFFPVRALFHRPNHYYRDGEKYIKIREGVIDLPHARFVVQNGLQVELLTETFITFECKFGFGAVGMFDALVLFSGPAQADKKKKGYQHYQDKP